MLYALCSMLHSLCSMLYAFIKLVTYRLTGLILEVLAALKMPCLFCFSDLSECNFLDCNIIVSDHLPNVSSAGSISQITAPLEGLSREINSSNFENVTKWSSLCVGGSENGLL